MTVVVIVACLVAAFLNASAAILQRLAAGSPEPSRLFSKSLILEISRHRKWLIGMGLQVLSAVLSAIALYGGSLVLVEPILTTDLIFLMLLLAMRSGITIGLREWGGAVAICLGLSSLLIAASPRSGDMPVGSSWWVLVSSLIALSIVAGAWFMRKSGSSNLRAGIGGVASGLNLALTASFVKIVFHEWTFGLSNVFSHWYFYALVASMLLSIIVLQATFAAGSLAISQPAIEISTPLIASLLGIFLLGDTIRTSAAALVLEVVGTLTIAGGIILLGGSRRIQRASV